MILLFHQLFAFCYSFFLSSADSSSSQHNTTKLRYRIAVDILDV